MLKDRLLYYGIQLFHRLPISLQTRTALRNFLFQHLGFMFKSLASWQAWQIERHFAQEAATPLKELQQMREEIFNQHFSQSPARDTFLFVTHGLGGGTEVHVQALAKSLEKENVRILIMRSSPGNRIKICHPREKAGERLIFDIRQEYDALLEMLSHLDIRHIHIHHSIDMPSDSSGNAQLRFLRILREISAALEVDYDFTAHDYFAICPRFTLFDNAVRGYCGEPEAVTKCDACVATFGSAAGKQVDVGKWREEYGEFLRGARRVFTPSEDTANRLKKYFPTANFIVRPHMEETGLRENLSQQRKEGETLRVLTIGAIAPHKGSDVLLRCATDAQQRNLPIHFTIVGYTDIDWKLKRLSNVTITGRYEDHDAMEEQIRKGNFHLVFLPAVWPETYNYTLSEALRYGFFPVAFDIGALADRMKKMNFGKILPLESYTNPQAINDALLNCKPLPVTDEIFSAENFPGYASFIKEYYELSL